MRSCDILFVPFFHPALQNLAWPKHRLIIFQKCYLKVVAMICYQRCSKSIAYTRTNHHHHTPCSRCHMVLVNAFRKFSRSPTHMQAMKLDLGAGDRGNLLPFSLMIKFSKIMNTCRNCRGQHSKKLSLNHLYSNSWVEVTICTLQRICNFKSCFEKSYQVMWTLT